MYNRKYILEALKYWKKQYRLLKEAEENAVLTQEQLNQYCKEELDNAWEDVIKIASCEIVEKAIPGKGYDTITWDDRQNKFVKEMGKKAKDGEWLIKNHYDDSTKSSKDKSQWLIAGVKLAKNYDNVDVENIKVGNIYKPKAVVRKGLQIPKDKSEFKFKLPESWGESDPMIANPGDWLIKDGNEIYRIAELIFDLTYKKGSTINESRTYTRKQIMEAINYWQKQLNRKHR